jgi:hypothetical protein
MDQPLVTPESHRNASLPEESPGSLAILPAAVAEHYRDGPFVVVVRTTEEFCRWLRDPLPGAEALQAEGLLGDPDPWALAAQGTLPIPIDVVLEEPSTEFSALYRLVDVRNARDVRVTIPAREGFLTALRLAVSLQLPVRLLPGQPDSQTLAALAQAVDLYLHDSMVETPVEFFHSTLAAFHGMGDGTLWSFLEQDPAIYSQRDAAGHPVLAPDFVEAHLHRLLASGAECADCRWQSLCAGYFKHPDPSYSCTGIKEIFAALESAAAEITSDLAARKAALSHE